MAGEEPSRRHSFAAAVVIAVEPKRQSIWYLSFQPQTPSLLQIPSTGCHVSQNVKRYYMLSCQVATGSS